MNGPPPQRLSAQQYVDGLADLGVQLRSTAEGRRSPDGVMRLAELGSRIMRESGGGRLDLGPLVDFGLRLLSEDDAGLRDFRDHFVNTPNALRWELLGRTAWARRQLPAEARAQLDVLGLNPDLLGPLRRRHDERLLTESLAWVLGRSSHGFGGQPLAAFVRRVLAETRGPQLSPTVQWSPAELNAMTVTPELSLPPYGRVDLAVEGERFLILVEAKVHSAEGTDQLGRYSRALSAHQRGRHGFLVFLTVDPDQAPSRAVPHLTFRHILRDFLPIAVQGNSSAHLYLRAYLATLARLYDLGAPGEFDLWDFAARSRALAFVRSEDER